MDDAGSATRSGASTSSRASTPEQKLRLVQALQGRRRGRRHDRRRRERRARAEGGAHRHRHGRARHRRRARGGRARAARRRLRLDRAGRAARPAHLRQPAQGDGLHRSPSTCRSPGCRCCRSCFGWPLVLLPVHVVFLELIIDPACSLVFEAEPEERTSCSARRAIRGSRCSPHSSLSEASRSAPSHGCRGSRLLLGASLGSERTRRAHAHFCDIDRRQPRR